MSGHIALEIEQHMAGAARGVEHASQPWSSGASDVSTPEDFDPDDALTSGPWFTEDLNMPHGVSLADVVEAATEATASSTSSGIIGTRGQIAGSFIPPTTSLKHDLSLLSSMQTLRWSASTACSSGCMPLSL